MAEKTIDAKLRELAAHFKVSAGSMNNKEWAKAVKKAAGVSEYSNLATLYDDTFNKAGKKADTKPVQSVNTVTPVRNDGATQVLPPQQSSPSPVNTAIKVEAPQLSFTLPAPAVTVGSPVLSVMEQVRRVSNYVFIFGSGVMLGLLLGGSKFAMTLLARGL